MCTRLYRSTIIFKCVSKVVCSSVCVYTQTCKCVTNTVCDLWVQINKCGFKKKQQKKNICRSVNVEINFAGVLEIQKRFKVTAQTGLLGGSHILM